LNAVKKQPRNILLTVLKMRKLKPRHQKISSRLNLCFEDGDLSLHPHKAEGKTRSLGPLFIRALIPFMKPHPQDLITS
jgi:hypothetical protein